MSLVNDGGSKLDPFIVLSVVATFEDFDGERVVDYEIEVANRVPDVPLPRYTVGPWSSLGLPEAGTYVGRLAVYVPDSATRAGFEGSVALTARGPDGDLFLNATRQLTIEPGTTQTFRFRFAMPGEGTVLRLIPSARFPASSWVWAGNVLTDRVFVDLK